MAQEQVKVAPVRKISQPKLEIDFMCSEPDEKKSYTQVRVGNGSDPNQRSQLNSVTSKVPYVDEVFSPRVVLSTSVPGGVRTAQSQ